MITVNASRREPICLRHQGENDAMRVAFHLSAFEADWPGGTPLLLVQRPRSSRDAEAYPVALSVDGHTAYWTVSASDIEYSGYGKAQIQWRVEDVLVKSCIYDTVCVPSLHAGAEPPDEPSKRWFDAIQAQIGNLDDLTTEEKKNLVAAINEAARSGGGSGGAGTIDMRVADGYIQYSNDGDATWENIIAIADLKGADGKDGTDGTDGAPGKDGEDGEPGKDGVTPDIKIGTVTTLPAGSAATASMGGTAAQPTLNLGIPKGANGDNANVTKDAVVGALGFTPISADDVPVKKVNGATGEVKSTFFVTITSAEDESISADKTLEEIYTAYEKGYAVYAKTATSPQIIVPLTIAVHSGNDYAVVFNGAVTFGDTTEYAISNDGSGWTIYAKDIAFKDNIPTIPTALKNPHPLNIKIGNATTSYDGSAAKTVEIPEGGGTDTSLGITGAVAGEFPKVSAVNENGAPTSWETVEGEEVTLGGDVPAPTDAQVSSAVDTWLTEHPEATTTVQDGAVTVEKLGYGKHIYGSKPYFCGAVGTGAQVYGSIGVVVPCKAGDTIYTTITVPTNTSWNVPKILTAFPENQYGDIASITLENLAVNNDTKQYAIGADKTTAKAIYIPQNFNAIPAANNGSVEDALAWINKTMGTDGKWCAQNVPFTELDSWYQTAQTELFDIDESCNKLMYASLYQAVSKLVGAKVAVLGDSLTEQSACSFIAGAYNDRWMENVLRDTALTGDDGKTYKGSGWFALIARKYKIKWWCAGHGMQWWYSTTARPNGATAMVRKLIDGTDEFDYIILEYGTNDILSGSIGSADDAASETATTSCGAIKWCIEQLQTRFPEASIVVILPNIHSGANGEAPAAQQTYLDAVVPILKKYGVRRVNMAEDSGIVKSMMCTDGVHLRKAVVSGGTTYYTNDTPAVRKFSKCLESVLLQA